MRKVARVVVAVVLSFLLQSTVLPYLKLGRVMLDLMSITLFTIGYALGLYAGVMGGLLGAMIMEVLGGNLPGLSAAACLAAGAFGAWMAMRIRGLTLVGRRGLEGIIKRFAPMVLIALFVLVHEFINLAYFYLTGTDITFSLVFKVLLAAFWAGVFSLVLMPLIYGFVRRKREDTLIAKWVRRQKARNRRKAKDIDPVKPMEGAAPLPTEGGTDI